MIQQTSLQAYQQIRDNRLLSPKRWTVYEFLFLNGPATQKECERALHDHNRSLGPRFAELAAMGCIAESGTRISLDTGCSNILWACTGNVPVNGTEKKPTRRELEAEIMKLKSELGDVKARLERVMKSNARQKESLALVQKSLF